MDLINAYESIKIPTPADCKKILTTLTDDHKITHEKIRQGSIIDKSDEWRYMILNALLGRVKPTAKSVSQKFFRKFMKDITLEDADFGKLTNEEAQIIIIGLVIAYWLPRKMQILLTSDTADSYNNTVNKIIKFMRDYTGTTVEVVYK